MSASAFYYACRNDALDEAKALLASMSSTEIDRMEPNGSTALHAASYYGHIDIVRLLLDKGASVNQKNKYGKTPEEEAKTSEIAQLIHDAKDGQNPKWIITDVFTATSRHRRFYSFNQGPPTLSEVVDKLLNATELQDNQLRGMDAVKQCFRKAIERNDAKYLVRAYTMESDFYRILNKTLVVRNELTDDERENPPWFCAYARFLASDEPSLRSDRWTGTSYRGMSMSRHEVDQYQVGKMVMNKAFLSTTKLLKTAKHFFEAQKINDKCSVIIQYVMEHDRSALDIKALSQYPNEEEVLLLPCMDFEVTKINDSGEFIEITLLHH